VKPGDRVELLAYGDERIWRRVVEVTGRAVVVCTDENWRWRSSRSLCVGFPLSDVLSIESETRDGSAARPPAPASESSTGGE
jgi:hypothetical protein